MTNDKYLNPVVPKDKAAQIIPYLNHIDDLRRKMFTYKEIADIFGMPSSTFRYALKRARTIVENDPGLTTDEKIFYKNPCEFFHLEKNSSVELQEEPDSMEGSKQIESGELSDECDGNIRIDVNSKTPVDDEPNPKPDQVTDDEDWAAKVMRTATPSKYAHRFNLKLKHQ